MLVEFRISQHFLELKEQINHQVLMRGRTIHLSQDAVLASSFEPATKIFFIISGYIEGRLPHRLQPFSKTGTRRIRVFGKGCDVPVLL